MTNDRVDAWGRVVIDTDAVFHLLYCGEDVDKTLVRDDEYASDYNRWCRMFDHPEFAVTIAAPVAEAPAKFHAKRQSEWFMPEAYAAIDIETVVLDRCESEEARKRVRYELALFTGHGMLPMLRFLHYMVQTLRESGVWWGVGRGSSVSSYMLFLLGVHKIDSIKYDLDIGEFLK